MWVQNRNFMAGRNIKSKYPRDQFLKIRISTPYKKLLDDMKKEYDTKVSDADLIEWALHSFAANHLQVYLKS